MDNFEKWLCREMPAGTVIGNPSWWAPRIMKAAQAEAQQTIAAPVINQQPASEPDTSESREAEIDKERHHGY